VGSCCPPSASGSCSCCSLSESSFCGHHPPSESSSCHPTPPCGCPSSLGNDTKATYEISITWQERGPVIEHTGNNTATRGNRTTAAIDRGEVLVAVTRNFQPVSGVPKQVQGRRGQYSKNLKSTIQAQAWHISFYPPLWTQLLETAKAEMQHALFHQHPFLPDKQTVVEGECYI